ncbi:hypothetical protein AHAS_Ahas05G0031500 [Arachis hypogaea]
MKLAWGLIHNREALWVKDMRAKYGCGKSTMPNIQHRSTPNLYVGDDFISWLANLNAYETFYSDGREDNRLYKHIWKIKLLQDSSLLVG